MSVMPQLIRTSLSCLVLLALGPATANPGADTNASDVNNPFYGKWTYRSWINDPEPVDVTPPEKKAEKMAKLLFAEAELVFENAPVGEIKGKLDIGTYGTLTIFGSVGYGTPFSIRMQGIGKDKGSPSEGWVYDYVGWLVPSWPNGVNQRPAIVGSVIRTVPHSNGQAKAGVVASFIAVRKE